MLTFFASGLVREITVFEDNYPVARERNFTLELLNLNQRISLLVNNQILEDPDMLADEAYVKTMEREIGIKNAGFVIRKDNRIIHGPDFLKEMQEDIRLTSFKSKTIDKIHFFNKQGDVVFVRIQDFYFKDKGEGSIFWALNIGPYKKDYIKLQLTFMVFTVFILMLGNGVLTILVYRSIIRPLKELQWASNAIKEGHYDYHIQYTGKDEFGEVISSFEEMREQLKKSIQMQHQYEENRKILLSHISHDLKTPITSIKGYIEGIKDGIADNPDKMEKYIDTVYKKATDMDELIDDLFLFSKLDLQKYSFDFKALDIVQYIKDMEEELQFDLSKRGVSLKLTCPDKEISIIGDGNNLRRVITNIMDNSIKYAGEKPLKIEIILEELKEKVLITFKDNGRGISEEALPFIFDGFYRADPSRNLNTSGSGLGLAIIKKIIEEHGGQVWVNSKLNEGTNIYFTLRKPEEGRGQ